MCKQGVGAPLADVYLRGTLLSGPVDRAFRYCSELVSLNLQVGSSVSAMSSAATALLGFGMLRSLLV
jgi:hypothetical protein